MAQFHALGLAPIPRISLNIPPDTRRVVLLVPSSRLSLLRQFDISEVFLALTGTVAKFDNQFVSVHMAFVRVRRGGREVKDDRSDRNDWRSLTQHLKVRDAREGDLEAELMVSAIVPIYALTMAPPCLTELQLRLQESEEVFQAPAHVKRRLGWQMMKVIYGADLNNEDNTAILTPGEPSVPWEGRYSSPSLACPKHAVSSRCEQDTVNSPVVRRSGSPESTYLQPFAYGKSQVKQSFEVISQPGCGRKASFAGRVTLVMCNKEAREHLAMGGAPRVEATGDPCSVRVVLGKELVHMARFTFPVTCEDVKVVYSESQGFAHFTVLPSKGFLEVPFALTACNVDGNDTMKLLSTFCWPMCVPLASLPRLDFNAEWAHQKVIIRRRHN